MEVLKFLLLMVLIIWIFLFIADRFIESLISGAFPQSSDNTPPLQQPHPKQPQITRGHKVAAKVTPPNTANMDDVLQKNIPHKEIVKEKTPAAATPKETGGTKALVVPPHPCASLDSTQEDRIRMSNRSSYPTGKIRYKHQFLPGKMGVEFRYFPMFGEAQIIHPTSGATIQLKDDGTWQIFDKVPYGR